MASKLADRIYGKGSPFWINFTGFWSNLLYFYIGVVLPLYLNAKGVSLTQIGILFSITQLFFATARLFLAAYADARGPGKVFLACALFAAAEPAAYAMSISEASVAFGKALSGMSQSCYWAVSRTILYRKAKDGPAKSSSKMQILMSYGEAIGRLLGGFAIQMAGFVASLWAASIASLLFFIPAIAIMKIEKVEKPKKIEWKRAISLLNFRKYSRETLELLKYQLIGKFADVMVFTFILPIYLDSRGFSFFEIGGVLAAFALASALASEAIFRFDLFKEKKRAWTLWVSCAFLAASAICFYVASEKIVICLAVIFLALADGARRIAWEENLALSVKTTGLFKSDPSLALAVFGVPIVLVAFVTLIFAGALADTIGYFGVFAISIGANMVFLVNSKTNYSD